jgi:hypothetical protein
LTAFTVIDGNGMKARNVEDNKILWTSVGTWTSSSGVAKLIPVSEVLERVFVEELPVPSLKVVDRSCG